MAIHPNFPESPHAILDPALRWFPADEALRESSMDKLMPPLVVEVDRKTGNWLPASGNTKRQYSKALYRTCTTGAPVSIRHRSRTI